MTQYLNKSFSVVVGSDKYRANWEQAFGKRKPKKAKKQAKKGAK